MLQNGYLKVLEDSIEHRAYSCSALTAAVAGALIEASVRMGAMATGVASNKQLDALGDFARAIGLAFQIQDDILDQEGNEAEMGKKVRKDKDLNKATIIRLKDLNYAKKEVIKVGSKIKKKLLLINKNTEKLIKLTNFLMYRTS